jgi:hypothetical protein
VTTGNLQKTTQQVWRTVGFMVLISAPNALLALIARRTKPFHLRAKCS